MESDGDRVIGAMMLGNLANYYNKLGVLLDGTTCVQSNEGENFLRFSVENLARNCGKHGLTVEKVGEFSTFD
ncbi:MAG: hypothetical protein VKL42_12160 [Snowella sp.]|nr:hypothetical protein [Snowella sp.]